MNSRVTHRSFPRLGLAIVCLIVVAGEVAGAQEAPNPGAASPTIERIDFYGNRRVETRTLHDTIRLRPGMPYNSDAVERDLIALWNTHFFSDVRVKVADTPMPPSGKILIFYLAEKPTIERIEFKGMKSISDVDILQAFREANLGIEVEKQFDPEELTSAAVVLKGLLALRGHPSAVVKTSYERIFRTDTVKLLFDIDEGPFSNGSF